ncbi:MAG: hemolysin family protein [Candidatus Thiodiazotropha sp.]
MLEYIIAVVIMVVLLALKGFYSGSEIALVSSDKLKLMHRARHGDKGAQLVLSLYEKPETLLSTTLVGTNLATIILTTMGTLLMIKIFGGNGELIAMLIFVPLLLILGEIVPKSIMQQKSDAITTIIIYPLKWSSVLFSPITYVFSRLARILASLIGAGNAESALSIDREQIRAIVEMTERAESARVFGRKRIRRVLRFADTNVAEVMNPVAELETVDKDMPTADAITLMLEAGFRQLTVVDGKINNIIGFFTATPWQMIDPEFCARSIEAHLCEPLYINPYQTIDEVFPELWKNRAEVGVVVDEFGSAMGVLTVDDIIEEVVGDVEFDDDPIATRAQLRRHRRARRRHNYEMIADNIVLMDARMSLSEANEILGVDLPTGDYHTVGGLVLARFRHIPKIGEEVIEEGYRFVVAKASTRQVDSLRVEPVAVKKDETIDDI